MTIGREAMFTMSMLGVTYATPEAESGRQRHATPVGGGRPTPMAESG